MQLILGTNANEMKKYIWVNKSLKQFLFVCLSQIVIIKINYNYSLIIIKNSLSSAIYSVSPSTGSHCGGTILNVTGEFFEETDSPAAIMVDGTYY